MYQSSVSAVQYELTVHFEEDVATFTALGCAGNWSRADLSS
jgi:hypothetical protein